MFAYCSLVMVQTWLLLALLSPALYAIANVIDKFAVSKRVQNCFAYLTMISAAWFLAALATFIFVPWNDVTISQILLGIVAGLSYSGGYYVYFYSLTFEEASRVVSLIFLSPIIVVGFAALFLGELLPIWKYGAILLAVVGAILIGLEKIEIKPMMRKGFWLMMVSCFFWATTNVINKYMIESLSFWNMFGLQALGLSLGLSFSLLSKDSRKHLSMAFKCWHFILVS
ncbi:MAG: DMT family transporter, partial [Nanoarchaeota archaeon]